MKCEKCQSQMFIDEWSGWYWTCISCDNSRNATDEEIRLHEQKMDELNNNTINKITAMELVNIVFPNHERTSCSDEKVDNGMDDKGRHRCSRCMMLDIINGDKPPKSIEYFISYT